MQDEEIAALAIIGGLTVSVVITITTARQKVRSQRLKVLETALNRQDLDETTRREILRVLTQEHSATWLAPLLRPDLWQKLSFGFGWFLFLISGGVGIAGLLDVMHVPAEAVVPMMLLGLALMTLPLGLRELMRRDRRLADQK